MSTIESTAGRGGRLTSVAMSLHTAMPSIYELSARPNSYGGNPLTRAGGRSTHLDYANVSIYELQEDERSRQSDTSRRAQERPPARPGRAAR